MRKLSDAQERLLTAVRDNNALTGTHLMSVDDLTAAQLRTADSLVKSGHLERSPGFIWLAGALSTTPATTVRTDESTGRKDDQPSGRPGQLNGGVLPAGEYPNGCIPAGITLPRHHAARSVKRQARHDRPCRATDRRNASAVRRADEIRWGVRL